MSHLHQVRSDFDRIAHLLETRRERAEIYDGFLLQQVPPQCTDLLEVGSGTGRMARLLAARAQRVTGMDASPQMTALASSRARSDDRVCFICADFMTHDFAHHRFDCIFSVTTLHHMPNGPALERMKSLLAPGGVLIIHDVRAVAGTRDLVVSGLRATATGEILHWVAQRMRNRGELARAWHDHGATDEYLDMAGVRALCAAHLPGAHIFNHPLWRYTIIWNGRL
jgi:SAM-dependent methyltransferase